MKEILLLISMLTLGYFSSNSQSIQNKITYDFSCMESDIFSAFINLSADVEKDLLGTVGDSVSISEEMSYGDSALIDIKKEYTLITEGTQYNRVQGILKKLTVKIKSPKGYNYSIYLIDGKEINAFTVGAKIYITTAMVAFCISDDEIACIIGHEIAHNELGHIRDNISRIKTARNYGVIGDISSSFASLITTSFNQKNETHSDFIGIDLAIAAGYNGCASSQLWKRMKALENSNGGFDTFFNSHPYSATREVCAKNHLEINYSTNCD